MQYAYGVSVSTFLTRNLTDLLIIVRAAIPDHPLQVLDYAARHHRSDLLAKIEGSEYILLSPLEASKYSNLPIYVAWVRRIWSLNYVGVLTRANVGFILCALA